MFIVECNCMSQALTCVSQMLTQTCVGQPDLRMLPQPVSPSPLLIPCVCCAQSCPHCDPMDCSPPGSPIRGFFRQGYWSGLPFPPPGDLPDPGLKPASPLSPALQVDSLPTEPPGRPLSS